MWSTLYRVSKVEKKNYDYSEKYMFILMAASFYIKWLSILVSEKDFPIYILFLIGKIN